MSLTLIMIMPSFAQAYVVNKEFFLKVHPKDRACLTAAGTPK